MTPTEYWLKRAPSYASEKRLEAPFYRDQEAVILRIVKSIAPDSVLEVGCNSGRVSCSLKAALPHLSVSACDLSPEALATAAAPKNGGAICWFVHDLYSADSLPAADLCIAIEVLLHHPREAVKSFVEKILRTSLLLLHEYDPAVHPGDAVATHCYAHDYFSLYREMGLEVKAEVIGEHAFMVVYAA
jgi:SAM-dependent methyltransferase